MIFLANSDAIVQLDGTRVKKQDGSACKSNEDTLDRWREQYDQALNHGPGFDCPELNLAANTASPVSDVRMDEPSLDEVVAAVKKAQEWQICRVRRNTT